MNKTCLLPALFGAAGLVFTIWAVSKAARASPYIPTFDDIMASQSLEELDRWYETIGLLYFNGYITGAEYDVLYNAYVTRFYELTGEAA